MRTLQAVLLGLALLLSVLWPAPASAQEHEPNLGDYVNSVRETAIAARRGDRLGFEDAGARLLAVQTVLLPDGTRITIDQRWLAAELARPTPDLPLIAERLGALADALSLPEGAAPADARQRLEQILSRPPFNREVAAPVWWSAAIDWLVRLLERILTPIENVPSGAGTAFGWLIGLAGALFLGGILLYVLIGLRHSVVRGASTAAVPAEHALSAQEAATQAANLIRSGDSRMAVRYMYLAALLWLDERKLLRYDPALTNREYLDRVGANPELRRRLAQVVATFDRVWYGHEPLSDAEYAEYVGRIEQLRHPDRPAR